MARTTATEVKEILETTLSDSAITTYIDVANSLVTEKLGSSSLSTDRLEQIEQWLSAHLIASTRSRMGTEEKVGEASIKYMGTFGAGLDSTPYGQMVKTLDTTGKFASIDKRTASIKSIKSQD